MGLSAARSLLIGTGFAICGASAIAGDGGHRRRRRGGRRRSGSRWSPSSAPWRMVLLPLLAGPLGLSDLQFGIWAGRQHPRGRPGRRGRRRRRRRRRRDRRRRQADPGAACSPRSWPRSASASGWRHRPTSGGKRPPIVPLFVLGFLACVALRSTGVLPAGALGWITQVQVAALGAALFGMGAASRSARCSAAAAASSLVSTLVDAARHGSRAGGGPAPRLTDPAAAGASLEQPLAHGLAQLQRLLDPGELRGGRGHAVHVAEEAGQVRPGSRAPRPGTPPAAARSSCRSGSGRTS